MTSGERCFADYSSQANGISVTLCWKEKEDDDDDDDEVFSKSQSPHSWLVEYCPCGHFFEGGWLRLYGKKVHRKIGVFLPHREVFGSTALVGTLGVSISYIQITWLITFICSGRYGRYTVPHFVTTVAGLPPSLTAKEREISRAREREREFERKDRYREIIAIICDIVFFFIILVLYDMLCYDTPLTSLFSTESFLWSGSLIALDSSKLTSRPTGTVGTKIAIAHTFQIYIAEFRLWTTLSNSLVRSDKSSTPHEPLPVDYLSSPSLSTPPYGRCVIQSWLSFESRNSHWIMTQYLEEIQCCKRQTILFWGPNRHRSRVKRRGATTTKMISFFPET